MHGDEPVAVSYGDRERDHLDGRCELVQYPSSILALFSGVMGQATAGTHGGERMTVRSEICWGYDALTCYAILDKTGIEASRSEAR